MDRRSFIKSSCMACVGGIGFLSLMDACSSQKYVTRFKCTDNNICLPKSEFNIKKGDQISQVHFVVLKPEHFQFPLVVYRISETEYHCFLLQCTHQGCELTPFETTMVCPCHGSEFNNNGGVSNGPADNPLKSYYNSNDKENIYIQL